MRVVFRKLVMQKKEIPPKLELSPKDFPRFDRFGDAQLVEAVSCFDPKAVHCLSSQAFYCFDPEAVPKP